MTRILMLTTGGTIASTASPDGLLPTLTADELMSLLPKIDREVSIDIQSLFHLDSSDMTPDHWIRIADAVRENYDAYDGFVITHGTDTMAYTAAALSYMIRKADKPIVITGAQSPIGFEITDAKANLHDSILYAADSWSRGVQVVFAGKVIAGTRVRKIRSMSYSAFGSINLPEIAEIAGGRIVRYLTDEEFYGRERTGRAEFSRKLDPKVFLLKLTPGMAPELLREIFRLYDAVVIESFGAGGIPESLEGELKEILKGYSPAEKVLAMTTQVTYEGSHMETYEVGRRLRDGYDVLEARDMTLEAVVTKLMWILGDRPGSWEEISRRFYEPVALDTLVTD